MSFNFPFFYGWKVNFDILFSIASNKTYFGVLGINMNVIIIDVSDINMIWKKLREHSNFVIEVLRKTNFIFGNIWKETTKCGF
jgi:hypothetical protein